MVPATTDACTALHAVVPHLVTLVRSIPDSTAASVGTWTVGDVAAHLSHAFRHDTNAIAGRPGPPAIPTSAGVAELNARMLAEDDERDPDVLADRIGVLAHEFADTAARAQATTVEWVRGVRMSPSAVACHLLVECLIHGHDIAQTIGRPWPVRRQHALLALEGGVFPLITALPPTAFLDQERAGSFQARFDLRIRGGSRRVLTIDRGAMTFDAGYTGAVDAHVSADPWALMLVFVERQALWKPVLGGQLAAWGRRPWKLTRLFDVTSPP